MAVVNKKDIMPFFHSALIVKNSAVQGQGVFVTEQIIQGTILIRFGGFLFNVSDRFSEKVKPSTSIALSETVLLAEKTETEKDLSDYINHSCQPNCGLLDAITLFAIIDIPKGNEVLVDYAFWEASEDYVMKEKCRCGSSNCRTVITGQDWRIPAVYGPNINYFSPFLRRRIVDIQEYQT